MIRVLVWCIFFSEDRRASWFGDCAVRLSCARLETAVVLVLRGGGIWFICGGPTLGSKNKLAGGIAELAPLLCREFVLEVSVAMTRLGEQWECDCCSSQTATFCLESLLSIGGPAR